MNASRLLVIAGHDPTGGAGIDADREAAAACGVDTTCIITALTRQDGKRVTSLGARPPQEWLDDARAALATPFDAIKTGLLPGADHVRALARLLDEACDDLPVVVDPVLAASGGEEFLGEEGIERLLTELLPRGVHLTPNVPEAARLTGRDTAALAADPDARVEAARDLLARGAGSIFLKGGHGAEDPIRDLLLSRGADPAWHEHPRLPGPGLHGSGCRTASAFAARLARGRPLPRAAAEAADQVASRIAASSS